MKKILLILILLFPFFVRANSISSIDMDITIKENGTAHVIETWNAYVNSGTEGWHPYYNIGKSSIEVTNAYIDGKTYEIVENWQENSSLTNKAYKAGIYYASNDEVDVVFGITEYGNHKYVIEYDITNFVSNLVDADMIYWTLFPYGFSAQPDNVTIKISGPYEYPDTLDVWGYGMYGAPCYVKDGAIYMTSDGPLYSGNYLTLLAKFPKETFKTTSILDNEFDYYLNMADEGAEKYVNNNDNGNKGNFFSKIAAFISSIFPFIICAIVIMLASRSSKNGKYDFGEKGKNINDVPNFRDIPCDKDIFYAFWISQIYSLSKNKNDFLGAVLLKWLHDGNIVIEKSNIKKVFKSKEETIVKFIKRPDSNEKEKELYDYMQEASGDNVLETDEFKKWCKNNYNKIFKWFEDTINYERDELVSKSLVNENQYEGGKIFKYTYYKYKISDKVREEAEKMKGLKQYLKEFSRIHEKEPIEVKLWNEYLMYAQILGMAKEVMEQFKKLYPEVLTDMQNYNYNYDTFVFVNTLSTTGVNAASAAKSAAESYSSGGGGFSSGGGGGGSFGGGGGGGGFR